MTKEDFKLIKVRKNGVDLIKIQTYELKDII